MKKEATEHVVAYSPIEATGWALITEEEWEMVISPSLQLDQMAPLVMVPAFILALIAIWFGAKTDESSLCRNLSPRRRRWHGEILKPSKNPWAASPKYNICKWN